MSARHGSGSSPDELVASAMLLALSVITAIAMCRVFADWTFLRPLLAMVIAVHAFSTLLRVLRVPAWIALPLVGLVIIEVIALTFYRDTLRIGLPTSDTLRFVRLDLRLVWKQFPTAVAPVPSEGSFLLAASVGVGLVAMISDAFAFRAYGRAEAVVPAGVLFIFTAALGTERDRVLLAAVWFAAALVVIGVLRALHGGGVESWLGRRRRAVGAAVPATIVCAGLTALGAAAIGPLLPGARAEPLLETRQTQSDVTEVLSPLVDIRSRLVNRSNVEMFTVTSPVARYWRASGLSEFDGTTWKLPDAVLESADGQLNEQQPNAQVVQQQVRISNLGGKLVPTAFKPLTATGHVLWIPGTDSLVVADDVGLRKGNVYSIAADVSVPTAAELRASGVSNPPGPEFLQLPSIPDEVIETARSVTAAATTPYDQARLLQDWFRTNFTYDLTVQRGHSDDAMLSFLRIRRGYCEQFAGTFAVMARSLGLPARVAVGFTSGDLRSDGAYHVLGKNAHAWPEVWFDDVGWVLFEPTPGRGAPGSEEVTGVAPTQDTSAIPVGDNRGDPEASPSTAPRNTTPTTLHRGETQGTATTVPLTVIHNPSPATGGPGRGTALVLALLVLAAWIGWMPAVVRRFTRLGTTPEDRVLTAWNGATGALQLAGASPIGGATPLEYATRVERELAVDHRSLNELARFVTRATYAPAGVGEPAALRAAVLHTQLDQTSRELLPWHTRLMCRLDPRLVRLRLIGPRGTRLRR